MAAAASLPPPLPRRPTAASTEALPDEPPPAYEPTPAPVEQTLEYGPTRPFQPPPGSPPRHQPQPAIAATPHAPAAPLNSPYPNGPLPPVSPQATGLGPPQFPFWNGANLTPAQTGFSEGPYLRPLHTSPYHPLNSSPYASPPGPPPHHPSIAAHASAPHPSSGASYNGPPAAPPPERDRSSYYEPTTQPTPGQAYLNGGRMLVYPPGQKMCPKCSNTGYKPFDVYSGYRGDDPNHPCRKCWQKHSRPFTPALSLSLRDTPHSAVASNYQRPLRLLQTPSTATRPTVTFTGSRGFHMPTQPGAIVVRPGDPRMGKSFKLHFSVPAHPTADVRFSPPSPSGHSTISSNLMTD
ncbi:hypothetical protein JCM11641_006185 [Rhodosporidiobolus odoratus]